MGPAVVLLGAWLVILMGFLGIVAGGFLRHPSIGWAGDDSGADSRRRRVDAGDCLASLAATADTFAAIALVTNAAGNFLGFGVVVPLYAVAILTTRALPRWIGWLGLLVGALAGWLGRLSPASSVISTISNIGFIGFFVFMLSMGIALLRRRSQIDEATQASAQAPS
jgi:hypothetical protein